MEIDGEGGEVNLTLPRQSWDPGTSALKGLRRLNVKKGIRGNNNIWYRGNQN